ncbi:uncharacterized protein LOC111241415 [Vigna radiata var. radiata]|uniref:Uncharacterized protein LOC111241415 n=1 Tax=Vigna radiata var. radiata TaxID=3916 RepID=A0A3Q0EV76_VIGRR|nr:uncharacterized protein LOC111241415 [Vigna radiata var. radiata]
MGFLNGSIPAPASTDSLFPQWERCNTLIMSWLLNSLSPSIAQSVIYLNRAIDIWTDLRERFSQSDLLRIVELQEEVYAFKQGTQNVTDYYAGLKALWEEVDNFRPMTVCGCSAKTYHTQDFIIRFLKGLDDRFSVVRSQVLLMEPLSSLNRIFSMVIQHERQQPDVVFSTNEPNSFANAAMDRSRNTTNKANSSKKCSYCHRPGHTMDVCYSKHGYPPGHPRYPGRPKFNPRIGSSAHSVVSDASSAEEKGTNESFTQDSGLNFTRAQFQHLLSLLQHTPPSGGSSSSVDNNQPKSVNLSLKSPIPSPGSNLDKGPNPSLPHPNEPNPSLSHPSPTWSLSDTDFYSSVLTQESNPSLCSPYFSIENVADPNSPLMTKSPNPSMSESNLPFSFPSSSSSPNATMPQHNEPDQTVPLLRRSTRPHNTPPHLAD